MPLGMSLYGDVPLCHDPTGEPTYVDVPPKYVDNVPYNLHLPDTVVDKPPLPYQVEPKVQRGWK